MISQGIYNRFVLQIFNSREKLEHIQFLDHPFIKITQDASEKTLDDDE